MTYQLLIQQLQNHLDKSYNLKVKVEHEDAFKGELVIPKGTRRPFEEYIDEEGNIDIPDEGVFTIKIKPDDNFTGIYISDKGTHKTWQIKNDLYYFNSNDYKCLVLDPKGYDMLQCREKATQSTTRLHPRMIKDKLDMYGLIPAFSVNKNNPEEKLDKNIVNRYDKVFAFHLNSVATVEELETLLNMPIGGGMTLIKALRQESDVKKIMRLIEVHAMQQSKQSIKVRFEHAIADEVLSDNYDDINIEEIWNKNKIPSISFYNRNKMYIRYYVSKIIKRVKFASETRRFNKLIVYEDAFSYLDFDGRRSNIAVDTVKTSLTDWRAFGFNQIFSIQNPKLIDNEILEMCTEFFIGSILNPDILRSYFDSNTVESVKNLNYNDNDTRNKYVQYAHLKRGQKRANLYYPFQPVVYQDLV